MSWEDAWQQGRTGWDAGRPAPALEELLGRAEEVGLGMRGRALVPGCGAGHDVLALARAGWQVVGLDVAPTAAARFEALRAADPLVEQHQAEVVVGDFFDEEVLGDEAFDLIWDYTFFCALEPGRRGAWARRCRELLGAGGQLVTLIFPVPLGTDPRSVPVPREGPPYPVSPQAYREVLVACGFRALELRAVEESHPGREGKEWLGRWGR